EARLLEAAAGGHLPLGLVREAAAGPGAAGFRVVPGNVDDRVVEAALEVGMRALGVGPVGAEDLAPPGRAGDPPGRFEIVREKAGEDEAPARPLGLGAVAGGRRELGPAAVGDGGLVDPEGRQVDLADRALAVLGEAVGVLGPHQEAAAEADHAVGGAVFGALGVVRFLPAGAPPRRAAGVILVIHPPEVCTTGFPPLQVAWLSRFRIPRTRRQRR